MERMLLKRHRENKTEWGVNFLGDNPIWEQYSPCINRLEAKGLREQYRSKIFTTTLEIGTFKNIQEGMESKKG
jgi:hypothetical protein